MADFVILSFRLALFRLFVISLDVMAGRKDENKSLKCRYFAWRFFVFSRSFFVISHGGFRYFVFSPGVISSFCYFAWRIFRYFVFSLGVISSWRRAITRGEKTKKRNSEMTQTSHHILQISCHSNCILCDSSSRCHGLVCGV